jgi:hypothetical protein
MLQGGRRKNKQEVETQVQKVLTLNLDQITKFLYCLETAIELDSLSFLKDTSNFKEQPKKQEDVASRKKEEEAVTGNSSADSVNSVSGLDHQICTPLRLAPW